MHAYGDEEQNNLVGIRVLLLFSFFPRSVQTRTVFWSCQRNGYRAFRIILSKNSSRSTTICLTVEFFITRYDPSFVAGFFGLWAWSIPTSLLNHGQWNFYSNALYLRRNTWPNGEGELVFVKMINLKFSRAFVFHVTESASNYSEISFIILTWIFFCRIFLSCHIFCWFSSRL